MIKDIYNICILLIFSFIIIPIILYIIQIKEGFNSDIDTGTNYDLSTYNLLKEAFNQKKIKKKKLNIAIENVNTATETVNNVTETVNISTEKFNNAKEKFNSDKQRFDNATKTANSSSKKIDIASQNIDIASQKIDIASQNIDIASQNVFNAKNTFEIAKEYENKVGPIKKPDAKRAKEKADTELSNSKKDKEKAEIALSNAIKDKENAEIALSNARKDKEKADIALSNAKINKENADTELSNAIKDKENADTILSNAKTELSNAKLVKTTIDNTVSTVTNEYNDAKKNHNKYLLKINRIKTYDSSYAYCLGGNIMCPSGNLIDIKDNYKNTYNYLCSDNQTQAICSGNFTSDKTTDQLIDYRINGIHFPFSTSYNGFTSTYPNNELPFISNESNNTIGFFNNGNLIESKNVCDLLSMSNKYICNTYT